MTMWTWVIEVSKAAWDKIKKLPGWTIGLLLLLVAIIWYCVKLIMNGKELGRIHQDRVLIEKERYQVIERIRDEEEIETGKILKKYDTQLKKIDERSAELQDQISEGPKGIATAWKIYLSGKKND